VAWADGFKRCPDLIFWSKTREFQLNTVAAILAGFDQFALSEWSLSGAEAREEHATLFGDLEPLRAELDHAQAQVDLEASGLYESAFRALSEAFIPAEGVRDNG